LNEEGEEVRGEGEKEGGRKYHHRQKSFGVSEPRQKHY
jgi:hypothetical protein